MRRGPASVAVVVLAVLIAQHRATRAQDGLAPALDLRRAPQFSSGIDLVPLEVCVKNRD